SKVLIKTKTNQLRKLHKFASYFSRLCGISMSGSNYFPMHRDSSRHCGNKSKGDYNEFLQLPQLYSM
ncbi:MAG TPA: hypothetical protein VHO90_20500, partial [Bacteroidales bacterium]|nr:hypothetical protein [Bacteroidales bacterium]